ncbi:hypothetical protein V6N13_059955 [Hibiscus sabdariffa]
MYIDTISLKSSTVKSTNFPATEKYVFSMLSFMVLLLSFVGCTAAVVLSGDCGRIPIPYPLSTGPNFDDQANMIQCTAGPLWFDVTKRSILV